MQRIWTAAFGLFALLVQSAQAQIDLQTTLVAELASIVDIKHAGDGTNRLFLLQQTGNIRILQNGQLLETPFLSAGSLTQARGQEQGVLSLAFPPDFAQRQRFYLFYTDTGGSSVVSRVLVSDDNPNIADLDSVEPLLTIGQPEVNHNGGRLAFGPDGYLYMSVGDGGGADDVFEHGQNSASLLGAIVRIDVSGETGFSVPEDNPFVGQPGFASQIWAWGLRNPWRISFDSLTGDLWSADVGQENFEEINFQPANSPGGENYGWSLYEGDTCFQGNCQGVTLDNYSPPVFVYSHSEGCSVTGGEVYRGRDYPALDGMYLFGDFCSGTIWGLSQENGQFTNTVLAQTEFRITTFGEDEVGNIYVAHAGSGAYLISDGPPKAPSRPITGQMSGTYVVEGLNNHGFFVTVSENDAGEPFLFFAWFTYLNGEPYWLVGIGFYDPGAGEVTMEVQRRDGLQFLDFSDAEATRTVVGTMTWRAQSCDLFLIDYDLDGEAPGTLEADRLTGIAGHECVD